MKIEMPTPSDIIFLTKTKYLPEKIMFDENIISNNSKNIKCPIYHSYDVYKFGKDYKTGH